MDPQLDISARTNAVKKNLLEAGFSHVGIATAGRLADEEGLLSEWLRRGYHGSMAYMARDKERRCDALRFLPSARSVISVAMNYYTSHTHVEDPGTGKISRYAWGDDYHDIMREKLLGVSEQLAHLFPGSESKVTVDAGYVLEKAWAVRAGIGWLGKHTNIITRDRGSWIFLGEILTSIELTPDSPVEDRCGDCSACIDACPTGAIVAPYLVDANACISYQTIESKRDEIPPEYADRLGGWIFGCDICQDVCPWNSFAVPAAMECFTPRPHNVAPDLRELSGISNDEFKRRYEGSPVVRAKYSGFLRNVRTVLRHGTSHVKL